ncbi:MAG: TonB-dependent receptor [Bacteroidota bacterium]|nr:TonB-dependent receptor [Bacteroidota bacterium]
MTKQLLSVSILILLFFAIPPGKAVPTNNSTRVTLSGYVKDAENGEALIGVTVYLKEQKTGASTNLYGFYSLSLQPGKYKISYSFIGYTTLEKEVDLKSNVTLNIDLLPFKQTLKEVVVSSQRPDVNIRQPEMSVNRLDMKTIRQIPALMGEVDLLKAIQLLPGVQAAAEGSSAFNVRGGSADQNLIVLDEATVYNASHLMGFFSVFNNDAIKDLKLYKGDIPASYGGRLSSLLDVRMKDGNNKKFNGSGGVGVISSRLTLEGPIQKDRTSFIASGRRTYIDMFFPLSGSENLKDNKLYFYDLNLKLNHQFNDNNRLFVSAYLGRDVFKNSYAGMDFGNKTFTTRWNHLYSQQLFSNLTFVYSQYDYELTMQNNETSKFIWKYNMSELGLKGDFTYYPIPQITTKFGFQSVYHILSPGTVDSEGAYPTYKLANNYGLENALFVSNEHEINSKLTLKYGLRYSWFNNIGKGTVYNLDGNYNVIDSTVYGSGKFFKTYGGFEPRLGLKYEIDNNTSVKTSYSRTRQYIQMASNGSAGTPMDLWFSSSPNVKPQIADQVALGIFHDIFDHKLQTSVEVYYKEMQNVIDFKDNAQLFLNRKLEAELRFGKGKAYGAEFMIQFPDTRLNGWVSYTWSRSNRTINSINDGKLYLSPQDKPHYINLVLNYSLSKRVSVGTTWIYATGAPTTFPTGKAIVGNTTIPIYTDRNTYRLPDYHRLDVALTLKGKEHPGRWWQGEWNFSVYNVYSRHNTWAIKFIDDKDKPGNTKAENIYLFPFIPSITYNFKF